MTHMPQDPLMSLSFELSLPVYQACIKELADRLKKKKMPGAVFTGILLAAGGIGALAYFRRSGLQIRAGMAAALVLFVIIGLLNVVYYPLLFDRVMDWQSKKNYEKDPCMQSRQTLDFYGEYVQETKGVRKNRIQWTSFTSMQKEQLYYLLKLTPNNGVIIPRLDLTDAEAEALDELLKQKFNR